MIKLERRPKPAYLSEAVVIELTQKFKNDGSSVWNHAQIKTPLLASSNEKCAFCECSLSDESKYMEVEHFRYKNLYKDSVVEWSNLLPSCKRCNIAKGVHDVVTDPLVNPYDVDPRHHLSFRLYQLRGKDKIGISTVDALDLNNSDRLVLRRFEVGEQVFRSVRVAADRLESYKNSTTAIRKNKLLNIVETILDECQPRAAYAATTATVALSDEEFLEVITQLRALDLWKDYLEEKLLAAQNIAFQ
ncbi:HNH endonuclease [Pseudomonas sp. Irchel 3E19]|uniref:HNH endonuclease n=1 Tax=Pseudomonas sp. Irchel 3E19 TaxID=2008981 RepID=UPI000BA3C6B1|nr:HNH endonuclease [Pseudomonas sp. Irchel 3E19]